jgi:DNA-binding MarR family transcriptional regulator
MKRTTIHPDDFSPAEMAAWAPFVVAATQVMGALETEIKTAFGIGHFDHSLLTLLLLSPRRQARMSDLAWALRLGPSNITHRVGRLEKRGLVTRSADPDDGRVVLARLTPKAIRLLRNSRPLVQKCVRRNFLDKIDPERLGSMAEIFRAIADSKPPDDRKIAPAQGLGVQTRKVPSPTS